MIKIISFDVDGTLVTRKYPDLIWNEIVPKLYAEKEGLTFQEAKKYIIAEYDKIGDGNLKWYDIDYWFNKFGLNDYNSILDQYKDQITYYPDTFEVLKELNKKYTLIIISNASLPFLKRTTEKIKHYFKKIISTTSEFKQIKANPEVYLKICNQLNIKPQELVHIGDHEQQDFQIPAKIGVKTFLIKRDGGKKGKKIVKNLTEFKLKILTLNS
ncbi:MAG: HAD family hydrolase [Candidatus Odinarchaeia archaeon]